MQPPARPGAPPREVVTVLRPEEVELAAGAEDLKSSFVGYGEVQEILFAGSVERLRVRMPEDGPVPVAPGGTTRLGAVLEVSRTLPEQRQFPVGVGRRVAVGARRTHVLPTPISSFTVVSRMSRARQGAARVAAARHAGGPHADAAQCPASSGLRGATGDAGAGDRPGQRAGRAVASRARCRAPAVPARHCDVPDHVVIFAPDANARRRTFAVAASLLRHIPAEAIYLSIRAVEHAPRRTAPTRCGSCSTRAPVRSPSTGSTCAPRFASAT